MRTLAALLIFLTFALPGVALAHAQLRASEPGEGAVVASGPTEIILQFNEPISPLVLRLIGPDGTAQDLTGIAENEVLAVHLPPALADGTHLLSWRVVSSDGHPVGGTLTFHIGSASAALPVSMEPASGAAREVAKRRIRTPRGNRIDKKYLYRLLNNRAYIGEAVHKGDSYPGEHDAIIDREMWDKVHSILTESPRKRAARTRADTPALLKGLLFGPDGAAFSPTHTRKRGKLYRYYVSQTVLKHGAGACPVGRVPAGEIEATVINQLRAVFHQPEIVAGTWKAARAQDGEITEADARDALIRLDPLWDELFPAEQARIAALLVERIDIGTDGLNVRLRVDGLSGLAREMLAGGIEAAA